MSIESPNILTLTRSMASTVLLLTVIVFFLDGCNRTPATPAAPVEAPVVHEFKTVVHPVAPPVQPNAEPVVAEDVSQIPALPLQNVPTSSARLLPTLDLMSTLTPATPAPSAPETVKHTVSDPIRTDRDSVPLDVRVIEAVTATSVDRGARAPDDITANFSTATEHAWAFIKVQNKSVPTHITMLWKHGNRIVSRKQLSVGVSPRWRTWSRLSLRGKPVGQWSVEVHSADGRLLQRIPFELSNTATAAALATEETSGS